MDLNQLRYFIVVAKHLNFTKAAEELYIGQSAISQQIKNLEEKIGVELFIRNKRSVKLTNAGKIFLKESEELLEKASYATDKALKAAKGITGSLKIGFLVAPVHHFLPKIVSNFTANYPDIEVDLHHLIIKDIPNDDIDIAFTVSLGNFDTNELNYKSLYFDSPAVFVNSKHPFANLNDIHLADLKQEKFISRNREIWPEWFDYSLGLCNKNGFSPRIIQSTPNIETLFMLVESGKGIAILPKPAVCYAGSEIRTIDIVGEKNTLEAIVYTHKENTNPIVPLFMENLMDFSCTHNLSPVLESELKEGS